MSPSYLSLYKVNNILFSISRHFVSVGFTILFPILMTVRVHSGSHIVGYCSKMSIFKSSTWSKKKFFGGCRF